MVTMKKIYCILDILVLLCLSNIVLSQNYESPCPELFTYEPPSEDPNTKWFGVIKLISDADLSGIYLRLIFDKKSKQLGNWFGQVDTKDNIQYLVKNKDFILVANKPHFIRFYITYNQDEQAPKLLGFRLNARTVCPKGGFTTTTTTTPTPIIPQFLSPQRTTTDFPLTGFQTSRPLYNQLNAPVCGTVTQQIVPLVLGGYDTFEGEFPWHVAVYKTENRLYLMLTCGGNLITRSHVLTAGHCITRKHSKQLIDLSQIQIFLGTSNLIRFNPGVQVRAASNAMIHPDYDPSRLHNDIGIIELSSPVDITDFVRTICLWSEDIAIEKMYGRIGSVVGWRHDNLELIPDKLLGATMPIIAKDKCIFSNRNFFGRVLFEKNYCGGFLNGTSVCSGDSGGGMVFPKTTRDNSVVWQLRGLVSASSTLQGQCNPNNYIVFTDVAQYLDWIKSVTKATKLPPSF